VSGYIMADDRETERLARKTERLLVRRHLAWAGLRPGESFVDFGCGSGEVAAQAARMNHGADVVGLDEDAGRRTHAQNACQRQGLPSVRFHAAHLRGPGSSGLAEGRFDHAWTRFFLEYQPVARDVVREMARVVRPGGKLTLIDLDGNCVWHFGMPETLRAELDAIIADLASTGFDPYAGRKLATHAAAVGLTEIREEIEPYHRIVGAPDPAAAAAWRTKLQIIRDNYVGRLFPHKADKRWVFDAFLEFLLSEDTMTWSLLHLVQATKPLPTTTRSPT
jgi:ubiquinone/menaquinone biosynthesis C-methylase UbiE